MDKNVALMKTDLIWVEGDTLTADQFAERLRKMGWKKVGVGEYSIVTLGG